MAAISKDRLRYRQLADASAYRPLTSAEKKELRTLSKKDSGKKQR